MTRLPAPGAAAALALLVGALGLLATSASALPPEPASAPTGAHVAAPPPAAAGAGAQSTPGITPLGNSKSPMDITAEGVEVIQPQRLTIFRGNVEVINDTTRLRTPELRVWNKPKAAAPAGQPAANAAASPIGADSGGIDHIEATGPVYYITPTQNARGDAMLYQADPDIITLTGHVVLVQGKSVAKGDKLIMYRKTGQNQLISNTPDTPTGRVRVILYPQDQQQGQGAKAPAAKPPARG
jgi:lipopolysaccharide export system protein LptA